MSKAQTRIEQAQEEGMKAFREALGPPDRYDDINWYHAQLGVWMLAWMKCSRHFLSETEEES